MTRETLLCLPSLAFGVAPAPPLTPLRRVAMSLCAAIGLLAGFYANAAAAGVDAGGVVTARSQAVALRLHAYAQVEPIAVVRVTATEAGSIGDLRVVPGSVVAAGEVLARIGGPRMRALLTEREQALRSAQDRLTAARRALVIVQRQLAAQLATQQAAAAAQGDLAAARAAVLTAAARLREAHDLQRVRAPVAGTVLAVLAADGEQTAAGQPLLTLQPAGRLWLRAAFYGADAALRRVGTRGSFQPSGADAGVAVKVVAISPALAADSGLRVGLAPVSPAPGAWWVNGQWGTVTLDGPTRSMVAVPTSALILDRGRWWVLVRTAHGDQPLQVVPGPTRGWNTWIASGPRPGQQVVVRDAFLEYHRGIARSYQPPD